MSPKYCSLAYDETAKLDQEVVLEQGYEPQLKIHVKGRNKLDSYLSAMTDVIQIEGRITVSF